MPQVTAAITTYNRAAYVVEALESVLAQTFRDFEVIVVDDGSTDDTPRLLEPYLHRIEYVRQANAGRAAARNAAIRRANGRYIAFLDSDDVWLPDKLERQVPYLDAHPEVGLAHGQVEAIDSRGVVLAQATEEHRRRFVAAHRNGVTYASYARRCLCFTSATIVRRDVFERIGLYDGSVVIEDLDLYLRIALEYEIAFVDGPPLARYRIHDLQTPLEERTRGEIAVCRKHLALLDERPGSHRAERVGLLLRMIDCYHSLADGANTRRFAFEALALDPRLAASPRFLKRLALAFVSPRVLHRARALKRGHAASPRT